MKRMCAAVGCTVSLALGGTSVVARAEPALIALESGGLVALGSPQGEHFGPGALASAGVYLPLVPVLSCGAKLRAGLLSDGAAPREAWLDDPGMGTFETATLLVRARPLARPDETRRAAGLFVESGGGAAVTGRRVRAVAEAAVGYGLVAGAVTLAPVMRYLQVVQGSDALSDDDARLLMLGLELTLFDGRTAAPPVTNPLTPAPAPSPVHPEVGVVADRDKDGVHDALDRCIDVMEDRDWFNDDDGCPDIDNDGDQITDDKETCPNVPEDVDGFQDEDGCPERDNDGDKVVDAIDQCPNEPETVNGNSDQDGCPDEGLLELKNDRIVLEESVLFESERARVRHDAQPLLKVIVTLYKQHPEWIKLRIEGHADLQGSAEFNQELSERRANNVMRALVDLGIPAAMIESVGFGSSRPRDLRAGQQGDARNRRVEFVVVAQTPQAEPDAADAGRAK
jgi:outer membrane protein OmpA-like peptidoglycan-associated protein